MFQYNKYHIIQSNDHPLLLIHSTYTCTREGKLHGVSPFLSKRKLRKCQEIDKPWQLSKRTKAEEKHPSSHGKGMGWEHVCNVQNVADRTRFLVIYTTCFKQWKIVKEHVLDAEKEYRIDDTVEADFKKLS